MKQLLLPTLLLSFSFTLTTAHAEIYKWTDASGKTHYSQTPPEKIKSKEIGAELMISSGKAAPLAVDKNHPEVLPEPGAPADLAAAQKMGEANKLKHADFCKQQDSALKQLVANPVINWRDEQGKERLLNQDERSAKIKALETTMSTICSPDMLKSSAATEAAATPTTTAAASTSTTSASTSTTDEKKP